MPPWLLCCRRAAVVLLARDTSPNAPAVKELNIDMSQVSRWLVRWCLGVGGSHVHVEQLVVGISTPYKLLLYHLLMELFSWLQWQPPIRRGLLMTPTFNSAPPILFLFSCLQWQPLIEDRAFVEWLVKKPSDTEVQRARHISMAQITSLEELWRSNPTASSETIPPIFFLFVFLLGRRSKPRMRPGVSTPRPQLRMFAFFDPYLPCFLHHIPLSFSCMCHWRSCVALLPRQELRIAHRLACF